jgi:hypothetical protein
MYHQHAVLTLFLSISSCREFERDVVLCLVRCVRLASARAEEVVASLKLALDQHYVARVQARVRRHRESAAASAPLVREEEPNTLTGAIDVVDDQALQALRQGD